jgi:SAM-dependent methyltransferase
MNNVCRLCGGGVHLFHKGIRDRNDIDVLKCDNCGLLQLSEFVTSDMYYQNGGMHIDQYHASTDQVEEETWELWIKETEFDDDRRYEQLKEICKGKRILDFGCGNGGFLRRISALTEEALGVEIDSDARDHLTDEGLDVRAHLDDFEGTFDVITVFQVVEHLTEPDEVLNSIRNRIANDGIVIMETPNSDEALISQYNNKAFMKFTFWTDHVMLYNSDNLNMLMDKNGFDVLKSSQVQRYPLSNHLYWLSKGKPGGHVKWSQYNDDELNKIYERILKDNKICDTLFHTYRKRVH